MQIEKIEREEKRGRKAANLESAKAKLESSSWHASLQSALNSPFPFLSMVGRLATKAEAHAAFLRICEARARRLKGGRETLQGQTILIKDVLIHKCAPK